MVRHSQQQRLLSRGFQSGWQAFHCSFVILIHFNIVQMCTLTFEQAVLFCQGHDTSNAAFPLFPASLSRGCLYDLFRSNEKLTDKKQRYIC